MQRDRRIQIPIHTRVPRPLLQMERQRRQRARTLAVPVRERDEGFAVREDGVEEVDIGGGGDGWVEGCWGVGGRGALRTRRVVECGLQAVDEGAAGAFVDWDELRV
jgi:hypothetical protein